MSFAEISKNNAQRIATGVVKFFNPIKGFGFIVPDDGGADLMIHATAVGFYKDGHHKIAQGDRVTVEVFDGLRGRKVNALLAVDDSHRGDACAAAIERAGAADPAMDEVTWRKCADICRALARKNNR